MDPTTFMGPLGYEKIVSSAPDSTGPSVPSVTHDQRIKSSVAIGQTSDGTKLYSLGRASDTQVISAAIADSRRRLVDHIAAKYRGASSSVHTINPLKSALREAFDTSIASTFLKKSREDPFTVHRAQAWSDLDPTIDPSTGAFRFEMQAELTSGYGSDTVLADTDDHAAYEVVRSACLRSPKFGFLATPTHAQGSSWSLQQYHQIGSFVTEYKSQQIDMSDFEAIANSTEC